MRNSILGFSQEALMAIQTEDIKIDMSDILILDYIQKALSQPSMVKLFENEQPYVWLKHGKMLEDLPILNIKENMLSKRLSKLAEIGLIESKALADGYNRGSRVYYTITQLFESLQYTQNITTCKKLQVENMTTCKKLHMVSGPPVKNYRSNNKLILDNKVNKISISKDIDNTEKSENFHFGKSTSNTTRTVDIDKFTELYNEHCFNLSKISKLTDNRIKAINKLLKNYSYEEIITVFDNANNSDFLKGNNDRGWKANIDFILREDKFVNILEGRYNSKPKINKQMSSDMNNVHRSMTAEQKKQFKEDIASGRAKKF